MTPGTRDGLCHSLVRARRRRAACAAAVPRHRWSDAGRGAALAPAVAARPRPLAGRRGVAAPGVDGVLPARRRRAAPAGRRGPPRPADARGDAGARRPARLPRRAARGAGVDGRLVAAGAGGRAASRAGDAGARGGAVPRGRRGAGRRWPGPWRAGGSPVLRDLADRGVVELLGGPATHPFLPLLDDAVAGLALQAGLDDARWRTGRTPRRGLVARVRPPRRPGAGARRARRAARGARPGDAARVRTGARRRLADGGDAGRRGGARPVGDRPGLVLALGLPDPPGVPRLPRRRRRVRAAAVRRHRARGRPEALVPAGSRRAAGAARRAGVRRGGARPAARRCGPSAAAPGAGRRRLGHRAVRPLVARGAGVPRGRAAGAPGGRGAHRVAAHGAARAGRRGRRRGRPRRRVVGRGQGLLGLVGPGRARPRRRGRSGCSGACSTCWRASAPAAGSPTGGVPTSTSSCGRLSSCCRATGRSW